MHLEQRTGPVPGLVYATFRRGRITRTFSIEIRQTGTGHYIALMPNNRWCVECQTIESALLMYASVKFPTEHADMPWLTNPKAAPDVLLTPSAQSELAKTA